MPDDLNRENVGVYTRETGVVNVVRRISWGAVWAGVMIALGMETLFTLFGLSIGFGMYHWQAANPWGGVSAWSTIWYLITAGWSMFFGAWCAARLSGNPIAGDGMLHGIATWGLATTATILIVAFASWAVLREGISVLSNAAIATAQTVNPDMSQVVPQLSANAGPMGEATAHVISRISLGTFFGVLLGFITSLIGGWIGQGRSIVVAPPDVVPGPTRRAA